MTTETHQAKFARAKTLVTQMFRANDIKPKTKLAHKLAYALWYGVFDGNLPPGVSILFLSGRIEMLMDPLELQP